MASAIPTRSTGNSRPEGLTWGRAGCGKTARPVREGRGTGNRLLTFIASVAVTSVARCEAAPSQVARTRWRQTHPVCWLQLAAGPYHRTRRLVGDKTLNVYLLEENPQRAEGALNTLAQALPFYSRTFCPFPWSHRCRCRPL